MEPLNIRNLLFNVKTYNMLPVYSRINPRAQTFDRRPMNTNVFTQPFAPIAKVLFREQITEARKRIAVYYKNGRRYHSYQPSDEYKKLLKKISVPHKPH